MKIILDEKESKAYLDNMKKIKQIYYTHNRLIELLDKCLEIQDNTIKFYNFLDREEIKELKKVFGRFYYQEFEEREDE